MRHQIRPIRVAIAGLAIAALAACSGTSTGGQAVATGQTAAGSAAPGPVAVVTASPALGDQQLAPAEPVTISVAKGTISSLTFSNPEGVAVTGTMSADKTSWTLNEPLGYGRTYTVSGSAVGTDGETVPIAGTYETVTPTDKITSQISPGDNAVVGVAAPVIVKFGSAPADKDLVQKHVTITTTPHVDGAWAWITHDGDTWPSLDWRPQEYWPAGTTVHVESDLYGIDIGGGQYGGDKVTSDFTIGRNQVVLADANSHNMVVQQNGVTVATYDASYGSGDIIGDPNRVTRSGTHIVMDKKETTTMSNPAYGYTDVTEHWAVRISDNGEFIHQNQETVADQGVDNVSHGCVNLSAADAEAYFNTAIYGDPVVVTGTSVQLSPADGDIYDWAIPWSEWITLANN
jgi:lipoprotein-anchoring transpeptidase ErfK/SrfK